VPDKKLLRLVRGAALFLAIGVAVAPTSVDGQDSRAPVVAAERIRFNKLANAAFVREDAAENVPLPQWFAVSGASNTAPIEVATPIPHGLETGGTVVVKGVFGNTAANGWWTITVRTPTSFALDGSAGNGPWGGGGSTFPADGQPTPPGPSDDEGDLGWTPWFSVPASIPQSEFFRFDGGQATGEIFTFPQLPTVPEPTPVTSFASQEIDGSHFQPGERLCLSIDAKVAAPASDRQKLTLIVTAAFTAVRVYRVTFPGPQLTDQYRRFSLCFALDSNAVTESGVVRVEFLNEMGRGAPPRAMFWTRPMLSEGFEPAPWTATVEPTPRKHAFY
jgi:hypothetical protein